MPTKRAGPVHRVRVRLSDAVTHQTIKNWVIVVRGAANAKSAEVRARVKARQAAAYEPGDRIETEMVTTKRMANPDVLRIPPMPSSLSNYNTLSGTALMRAWDKWTADVQAIHARFDGQPAYVKEMWTLLEDGFGRVSKDGEVVTFDQKVDDHLWRKYPALKGRKTASIRLLENGDVVAMRGPAPAKRAPKAVGRKAKAGKKTSVRKRVSSKRVANPRTKRATVRRKTTRR